MASSSGDSDLDDQPSICNDSSDIEIGGGTYSVCEELESEASAPETSTESSNTSVMPAFVINPDIRTGDLGRVVKIKSQRKLSDHEKFFLLKNYFVPAKGFKFPSRNFGAQNRQFQMGWLDKYNGLTYSETEDGGFCLFCVLFGQCEASVKELGILVSRPLTNFKKAIEMFNEHFVSQSRKSNQAAMEKAMAFIAVKENRVASIDQQLSSKRAEVVAKNRLKLRSIAATVIFCGRQALAFRGHDEDDFDVESDNSGRLGNFLSLLKFRIDAGDEILKDHLREFGRNAMYTSEEVQNEMIQICGNVLRNKILQKIREAKFYSIIADEATDSANDEQLSISIRFVDNGIPKKSSSAFISVLLV